MVVVKIFSAKWCKPCEQPKLWLKNNNIWHEVVDVEESPEVADRYGVSGLPTLLIEDEKGKIIYRKTGTISPHELETEFKDLLR